MRIRGIPITPDSDTLSRWLICHNRFLREAWPFLRLHPLPFLPPSDEEEKRKRGGLAKQRRGILKQEFFREDSRSHFHLSVLLIYRWRRAKLLPIQIFDPQKVGPCPRIFVNQNKRKSTILLKHKTLLPSHNDTRIEDTRVTSFKESNRFTRQLSANCVIFKLIQKIYIYDPDPILPTKIKMNLRHLKVSYHLCSSDFLSVGSDKRKSEGHL